jgi:acetolactate synthase-1/2/3 large subunit
MNVSEYVLNAFKTEGVNYFFMAPGILVDPIMSALHSTGVQGIVAAHEAGAIYMADGYAKVSRKFGAAGSIGGPGLTNMASGIATAYSDRTPIFVLTGEVATSVEGRGAFQDSSVNNLNSGSILASITNKRYALTNKALTKPLVNNLLRTMLGHATRGPVQLSIPIDLQKETFNESYTPLPTNIYESRLLDKSAAQEIWSLLQGSNKIAILAGSGALQSDATDELIKTAENFEMPVITTLIAHSVFPQDHRLSLGVSGWYGSRHSMELLLKNKPEVLIVLGSRLHVLDSLCWTQDIKPTKALVIVDLCENNLSGDYPPELFIPGDIREFLRFFNKQSQTAQLTKTIAARKKWVAEIQNKCPKFYDEENLNSDKIPIHPARVSNELRRVMPKNTVVFFGESSNSSIVEHYWHCFAPHQYFSTVKFMSPMGWSAAAAIGGKLARPDLPVVSLIGDGSMLMHGIEIQTAARFNAPVIFIVLNNGAHGNPQLPYLNKSPFEENFLRLPIHDWTKFAEALGLTGMKITQPDELAPAFKQALQLNKPVVIDIRTGNYPTPSYVFDHYAFGAPIPAGKL